MTHSLARRLDRSVDPDLAARRLLLAAVVASLWPLLYARWCWQVVLQAHNARTPQRPPGEPLAGHNSPPPSGGILDASPAMLSPPSVAVACEPKVAAPDYPDNPLCANCLHPLGSHHKGTRGHRCTLCPCGFPEPMPAPREWTDCPPAATARPWPATPARATARGLGGTTIP